MTTSTVIVITLLSILALFQLALVCGAPLGKFAWGGSHKVLPLRLRVGSAFFIIIYACIAALVLTKAAVISLPIDKIFVDISLWVIFAYFVLGVLLNGISKSKPERLTMTPVCIVFTICMFFIATT